MDLDDFRKLRHPDKPELKPLCSDEAAKYKKPHGWPSFIHAQRGEVSCTFAKIERPKPGGVGSAYSHIINIYESIYFSRVQTNQNEFRFLRLSQAEPYQLVSIDSRIDPDHFSLIADGLRIKYAGHKISSRERVYQNRLGGTISGSSLVISNDTSTISLQQYYGRADTGSLRYSCNTLDDELFKRNKKWLLDTDKM